MLEKIGQIDFFNIRKLFNPNESLRPLEELMRHLDMLDGKITLKDDAENPLTLPVKAAQGNAIRPVPTNALPGPDDEDL